mgnify:CR=1 FL=1
MNKEELLNKYSDPIVVGKHGLIQLIDVMGDDDAIVQAARTSYGKGTQKKQSDKNLIRYLIRNHHWTPVEMCEIKIFIKAPIHVIRQLIRHRTASVNEYSTRYSEVLDEFETFDASEWRLQSGTNKQGSAGTLNELGDIFIDNDTLRGEEWATIFSEEQARLIDESYSLYDDMIKAGVAKELARNVLPLSLYTQLYWKIDLRNLFNFLKLRLDAHAQQEIREFAEAMYSIVKDWVPEASGAFEDYILNAVSLSRTEYHLLLLSVSFWDKGQQAILLNTLNSIQSMSDREKKEFKEKFRID